MVTERPAVSVEAPSDHLLVSAVRRGDERAFEQLYSRYRRRVAAYVCGMVKDYGRAEDISQEVFVSALRRMRETERPIAFKPWIYEIAKNACIDAYRRGRRAEEVSFDADDRLSPADHGRLVAGGPQPDAAVDAKQELDHLCGAFGGLSDSHHEILVLRELEGRSYKDIGERMGMSRSAVESTLFRARKRLGEEYDELASGARCLRIQAIIAASEAQIGVRDKRRLARHVSHCQPCRRLAAHAGLDIPVPARRRVRERIAGWLPLPAFLRLRRGDEAAPAAGSGGGWIAHGPAVMESLGSGWGKAAAGLAALLVAGVGVGVTTQADGAKRDERGTGAVQAARSAGAAARTGSPLRTAGDRSATAGKPRRGVSTERGGSARAGSGGRGGASPGGSRAQAPAGGGGSGGGGPVDDARAPSLPNPAKHVPGVGAKIPGVDAPAPSTQVVDDVVETVAGVTKPVVDAAKPVLDATKPVTDAAKPVLDAAKPVTDAAKPVTNAVKPVTDAAKPVTDTVKPLTDAVKPVTDAAKPVTDAAGGLPVP